ncbi:hypothetical protein F1609_10285 [Massilia sp. CCM 8693]|uniref:Uncharacterized protein n=1 Tax=Massilia aquatica TaxID=2609000 RepID=A0ABX0M805_9BURK|nr:hypothetical protein [Massilia aquatica]
MVWAPACAGETTINAAHITPSKKRFHLFSPNPCTSRYLPATITPRSKTLSETAESTLQITLTAC